MQIFLFLLLTIRINAYNIIITEEQMTKLELERKFRKAGWTLKHGSRHDLAVSPTGQVVAIPRHAGDLKKGTAQRILKEAGLS